MVTSTSVQKPAIASSIQLSDLVDQVVKTPLADVADIHGRPLTDRFQAFQDLDAVGGILGFRLFHFFVLYHFSVCFSGISYKHTKIRKKNGIS